MAAPWFAVEVEKKDVVVVDCGYVTEQLARDRADLLRDKLKLGRRCFCLMLYDRLVVTIPPTKVKHITALGIVPVKKYWGTTHSFMETSKALATRAGGE